VTGEWAGPADGSGSRFRTGYRLVFTGKMTKFRMDEKRASDLFSPKIQARR
jgi:hypothetical protein